ncbi:hypothetical protein [uncultured Helicobacter sp.]|uniref:hypothetical protein n=1 Tax=uncultured Helicobacter sp. TaxID=175537 RepID=UPI003751BDED
MVFLSFYASLFHKLVYRSWRVNLHFAPLREHTRNLEARFCDCLVSARQERGLAFVEIL